MKIVALIENKSKNDLIAEHGLAVYIEYNGHKYLLDAGSSANFMENAKRMQIHLDEVEVGILSHTHYDHSGGYGAFFKENQKAKVLVRDKGAESCYAKLGFIYKYIGIPKSILENYKDRFEYISGKYKIHEGVWLLPHTTEGLEKRGKAMHMARKVNGKMEADDFAHEQSLVFECKEGLVILNSCSHGGVDHILKEVQEVFPGKKLLSMIGGFHLMGLGGTSTMAGKPQDIKDLAQRVKAIGVSEVYTGHCTGDPAFKILKEELGEKLCYFETGTVLEYEE